MSKFKIGDRVVLIEHGIDTTSKLKIGQQGTVVKLPVRGGGLLGVSWDGL